MSHRDDALKGSETRLWRLVEERTLPGADTVDLDRRIWNLFGEDWAILFTDLAGFSRRVSEFGIVHFLQVIFEQKRLLLPIVDKHDGILVKVEADSFMLIFRRPEAALVCAVEMQRACSSINARRRPEEQILLCAGIGFGHILRIGDSDVFGEEVNYAGKLGEDTAKSGEVLLTEAAKNAVGELPGLSFEHHAQSGVYRTIYA